MWVDGRLSDLQRARFLLGGYGTTTLKSALSLPLRDESIFRPFNIVNELRYRAGLGQVESKSMLAWLVAIVGLTLLFTLLKAILLLPALLVGLFVFEHSRLKRRAFLRAQDFERDYPALLLSLASAVRTGLDPLVALTRSADLFAGDAIIGNEIRKVKERLEAGATEEGAISEFASSIEHPDIQLFRAAFILARKEGSSLSECLQRLAKVTRQRQSFRRRVRSSVAMQKLSAIGIAVCAVAIAGIQGVTNPNAFAAALGSSLGIRAILLGVGLVLFGLVWMLSMTRSRL